MSFLSLELSKALLVFLISMTPVVELRGAIPYAAAMGMPVWETLVLAIAGNMILTPFIILCVRRGLDWLKTVKIFRGFAEWSERHIMKHKGVLEKYEIIGLAILVAVPLPGTGAWTGAMLAGLLGMRLRTALPAIFVGVLVAALIVGGVSYGFIGALDFIGLHA